MTKRCYVNGIGSVSFQGIWRDALLQEREEVSVSLAYAKQPSYKDLIAPAMIRRMSKGIKMGIFAAQQALDEAETPSLDAILTGTGLGCLEDSERFLKNILDNEEEFLTPTSFIQSTHNTVGAQIALRLACKAYNFTYVNGVSSFESALMDGLMQVQSGEAEHVLVGGVDEISGHTFVLKEIVKEIKSRDVNETIKDSKTVGVNFGEGTTFFVLSDAPTKSCYAEVVDTCILNHVEITYLSDFVSEFLQANALAPSDISVLGIGNNGDLEYDAYYSSFQEIFSDIPVFYYKQLVGQSDVASSFGMAIGADLLKKQAIDKSIVWREGNSGKYEYVLLYNQYKGNNHSLTLLRAV